jgi:hypothetical protein
MVHVSHLGNVEGGEMDDNAPKGTLEYERREAFERGQAAGVVAARLEAHDAHFKVINGHIAEFSAQMSSLTLAISTSQSELGARKEVAQALKEADETRRHEMVEAESIRLKQNEDLEKLRRDAVAGALKASSDKSSINWQPWAKGFVVITVLIQAVGLYWNMVHP